MDLTFDCREVTVTCINQYEVKVRMEKVDTVCVEDQADEFLPHFSAETLTKSVSAFCEENEIGVVEWFNKNGYTIPDGGSIGNESYRRACAEIGRLLGIDYEIDPAELVGRVRFELGDEDGVNESSPGIQASKYLPFKVKILKACPEAWYEDSIGETFDVVKCGRDFVCAEDVDDWNRAWFHIDPDDCEKV